MVQCDGYCLCVSYKLLEIQEKDCILCLGMIVVDLGVVLGGWLQVISWVIGDCGWLIVLDIFEMDSIFDVIFIQGDFIEDVVFVWIFEVIGDYLVDFVIFDMVFNMSGVWVVDQLCVMYFCELVLDLVGCVLWLGGDFLIKIFQGEGFDQYYKQVWEMFDKVQMCKFLLLCDCLWEQYLFVCGFCGEQIGMIDFIVCLLVDDLLCWDG